MPIFLKNFTFAIVFSIAVIVSAAATSKSKVCSTGKFVTIVRTVRLAKWLP